MTADGVQEQLDGDAGPGPLGERAEEPSGRLARLEFRGGRLA